MNDTPHIRSGKGFTVEFDPNENIHKVGSNPFIFSGRPLRSYFCRTHDFVETGREYHYDSSETARVKCRKCGLRASF